jgi:Spy/CpxP family protein refolding chaperone
MKTFRRNFLTGLAALSMGAAAFSAQAQTQPAPQQKGARPHLTPEQRQAKRAQYMAQRATKLHADLGITPAQESAWTAFVASMKPASHGQHMDRAAWAGLSAPQRMQKQIDLQKQRTAMMEQRLAALNTFYSVLSPQQKQIFDTESAQMQAHRFGHGEHGGWQRRGQAQG